MFNNYTFVSDLVVIIMAITLIFLLHSIYTKNTSRMILIKASLYNLIFSSILSIILNYYCLPNIQSINKNIIYVFHNSLYISLINELSIFVFYIFDLINLNMKWLKNLIIIFLFSFYILELTSAFTKFGFYIEDSIAYQNALTNIYIIWYAVFMLIITISILYQNKSIINKIYLTLIITLMISLVITCIQYICKTEAFTTLTYLIPILVMIVLFHSNSYNTRFGTLGKDVLDARLYDLIQNKKQFIFVYVNISNFQEIKNDISVIEDFKNSLNKIKYKDFIYKISEESFVMLFNEIINEKQLQNEFTNLHKKYEISHKVVILKSNNYCVNLDDYINMVETVINKPGKYFYEAKENDFEEYRKIKEIKKELKDIEFKADLNDDRVKVYCQPILNIETNTFSTAESLMRLKTSGLGLIMPDSFIPIAESEGRIHILTLIILNKVCQYIETHQEIERISVNFSMCEITKPGFFEDVINILSNYTFDYSKIGFEVTETTDTKEFEKVSEILQKIRNLGIKIYLDDFGTDYSNIEHLLKMPIDIIKFDRTLVVSSGKDFNSKYVIGTMSSMFSNIGYNILYEGIEDDNDQRRCIEMQAEYLQGYRYSRPIPIEDFSKYINKTFSGTQIPNS